MERKRIAALAVLLAPMVAGASAHFASAGVGPDRQVIARDTATCLDTLRANGFVSGVVTMRVRPQDRKTVLPPDFEALFVQEFRSRLSIPKSLTLSVMHGWTPCDSVSNRCAGAAPFLSSHAYATAHRTGTLSRIRVIDFSLTPAFSDTVRAVLERMSKENTSPLLAGQDSVPLEISIEDEYNKEKLSSAQSLFHLASPHYNLPFTPAKWPKGARGPKYPAVGASNGVEDSVVFRFVVLPDGTVDRQALDLEAGHYTQFIRSSLDRLADTKYVAARVGGCPVASWMRQTFTFQMPY